MQLFRQILITSIKKSYNKTRSSSLKFEDANEEASYQNSFRNVQHVKSVVIFLYIICLHIMIGLAQIIQYACLELLLINIVSSVFIICYLLFGNKVYHDQNYLLMKHELILVLYWFMTTILLLIETWNLQQEISFHVLVILYYFNYLMIFQAIYSFLGRIIVTMGLLLYILIIDIVRLQNYYYLIIIFSILIHLFHNYLTEICQRQVYHDQYYQIRSFQELNDIVLNCTDYPILVVRLAKSDQQLCVHSVENEDISLYEQENDIQISFKNEAARNHFNQNIELINFLAQLRILHEDSITEKLTTYLQNQQFQFYEAYKEFQDYQYCICGKVKSFSCVYQPSKSARRRDILRDQCYNLTITNCIWNGEKSILIGFRELDQNFRSQNSIYQNYQHKKYSLLFQGISHELKTPLNAMYLMVQSCLQIIKQDNTIDSFIKKELTTILDDVQHNNNILQYKVNDLLDFKHLETSTFQLNRADFEIQKTMENIKEMFIQQFNEKNLELEIQCNVHTPIIYSDENRLKQILINLIQNALKFTIQGKVSVIVNEFERELISFEISDTGIGVPHSIRNKLFQLDLNFTKGQSKTQGSGLGLTISRLLVGELGPECKIYLDSTMDKGSSFFFLIYKKLFIHRESRQYYLPSEAIGKKFIQSIQIRHIERTESKQDVYSSSNNCINMLKRLEILIVDDTSINIIALRCLIERLLQKNCQVDAVFNGLQAVEAVQQKQYTLIFMDINMPIMDGLEATKQIRQLEKNQNRIKNPSLIVITTAYTDKADEKISLEIGADFHFQKPIKQEQLQFLFQQFQQVKESQVRESQ